MLRAMAAGDAASQTTSVQITVNREIFVHENIHVLNFHVNKFLWVPHENILT